jgi:hypothetical protein
MAAAMIVPATTTVVLASTPMMATATTMLVVMHTEVPDAPARRTEGVEAVETRAVSEATLDSLAIIDCLRVNMECTLLKVWNGVV